ncbi:helix-turn-helix domain-containing protein [Streptomyces sp. NPDC051569]|uniref:helix-turn-helix domain-containing protein n=1 Tax=Streptomyces sp. NPDC051569 TaxID=3365661 RepID=UPI0037A0689F
MSGTETLGSRIRRLRRAAGLSQDGLAGQDLSPSYISRLEADKRIPSPEVTRQLAERLGCAPEYLSGAVTKPDTTSLEVELRYAEMAMRSGDPSASLAAFEELRRNVSASEHRDLWYAAELGAARSLEHGGRLEEAVVRFEALRRHSFEEGRTALHRLTIVMSLCRCYRELGDLSHAIELAESTLTELQSLKLPPTVAYLELLSTLVGIYCERGDLHRADYLAAQAIEQAGIITDRKALGAAYWNASIVLHRQGRSAEALTLISKAVAIYSEGEDERALARVRNAYAGVLLQSDDPDPEAAKSLLRQSASVLSSVGSSVDVAYVETAWARAELMAGEPREAVEHAHRALDLLGAEHRLESARAYLVLAAAQMRIGDQNAAQAAYERGAMMLEASEAGRQAGFAWSELAEILELCGESERALWAYRQGMLSMGHRGGLLTSADRTATRY